MNYLIKNEIIYNSFDGSLRHIKDELENSIVISKIANSILLLLISRQGEVISRDMFFSEVWDKEGLISSTNTLNQYMSKLRRIFSDFFPDETIITTIPRIGYLFTKDISVSAITIKEMEVESSVSIKKKLFCLASLIIISTIFVFFISDKITMKSDNSTPRLVYYHESCPVYEVSGPKSLEANDLKDEFIHKAIFASKLSCEVNSIFYIFANKLKHINKESSVLVSRCIEGSSQKSTCVNVYFTIWK